MAIWSIDVIRGGCSCISLVGRYIIGSTNFRTSEKKQYFSPQQLSQHSRFGSKGSHSSFENTASPNKQDSKDKEYMHSRIAFPTGEMSWAAE
jgi:hypothetical protein